MNKHRIKFVYVVKVNKKVDTDRRNSGIVLIFVGVCMLRGRDEPTKGAADVNYSCTRTSAVSSSLCATMLLTSGRSSLCRNTDKYLSEIFC